MARRTRVLVLALLLTLAGAFYMLIGDPLAHTSIDRLGRFEGSNRPSQYENKPPGRGNTQHSDSANNSGGTSNGKAGSSKGGVKGGKTGGVNDNGSVKNNDDAATNGGKKNVANKNEDNVGENRYFDGEKDTIESPDRDQIQTFDPHKEILSLITKAPIVVFSKTYCPFSKNVKEILLKTYTIEPKPFIVELDTHPHGAELQKELYKITNVGTVPNVLVTGESIGGFDEVSKLLNQGVFESFLKKKIANIKISESAKAK